MVDFDAHLQFTLLKRAFKNAKFDLESVVLESRSSTNTAINVCV